MENNRIIGASQILGGWASFMRKCLFQVVSVGPIPDHIAFIMDGNRRFAKKRNMPVGEGHKAGFLALVSLLRYCYEMGVKYVTVYAFSIDNFRRRPEEVQTLMDLMLEKIEALLEKESIVNQYGIRLYFIGNLKLLSDPVRSAAEKAMKATANNSRATLLICVAYTSTDEIVHAVQESCIEKLSEIQAPNTTKVCNGLNHGIEEGNMVNDVTESDFHKSCNNSLNGEVALVTPKVKLVDLEKHMYMAVAPEPDIVIRTSGETRLSNFLLWQSGNSPLYAPAALWPELGFWSLVWAVLNFQRDHYYLEKKKKQE